MSKTSRKQVRRAINIIDEKICGEKMNSPERKSLIFVRKILEVVTINSLAGKARWLLGPW